MLWINRHRRFREEISAYLDGRLGSGESACPDSYLHACVSCRAELGELRLTVAALRELPLEPPPRSFALTPERLAAPGHAVARAPSPGLAGALRFAGGGR